ncbi:probable nucleoredoxin 1 [Spinacia oleracea]|uniref:Probable nucleoredoxin 1 n=1 Tax=Spinacia oleracea TaxID=3562 RepID=A0A9R0J9G5_SPIOL|nr:probable nucleoredoxin 1 [Spinacia oleracea]
MYSRRDLSLKSNPVIDKLGAVIPTYPDLVVSESKAGLQSMIEIGKKCNFVSLLSGDGRMNYLERISGRRVEVKEKMFSNKYIPVCCLHVPIFGEDFDALYLQSLITTCSELYSKDILEMVVVAKMNPLANYEGIFDHFLSGFPSWCLAVPFEDSQHRDFICRYLDFRNCSIKCLLLNAEGTVFLHEHPSVVRQYGAEAFPFTQDCLPELDEPDIPFWKTSSTSTLGGLLQCESSFVLGKTNPNPSSGESETTCISQLQGKVVGLYLCWEGNFIGKLHDVYKHCKEKSLEFEIVLVYIPFGDCLDPELFIAKMNSLLLGCNASWWCFPFNNSVSHRFRRLAFDCGEDRLIIMGPNDQYVDPFGREVMEIYRCDSYPFTREVLVEREINKLKKVNLESLFLQCKDSFLVEKLRESRGTSTSFEVVFVRMKDYDEDTASTLSPLMPWLVCPFDVVHSTFVEKELFGERGVSDTSTLVSFDKNGRLCLLFAQECLKTAFPFADNLRKDVILHLQSLSYHDFMDYFE